MDSLAFLEHTGRHSIQPVYVVHGDEDFLKRRVRDTLRALILGGDESDLGLAVLDGERTNFSEVHDELDTLPLLGSRRLVVVENADPFVTEYRAVLERFVGAPASRGVLVLDVHTWPSNTRLARLLGNDCTIVCKAQHPAKLPEWCVGWAAARHGKEVTLPAARLLVELIGAEMGQLDQELAKLATYVGAAGRIDEADVDRLVGNSRAADTWKILGALGEGRLAEGIGILDRLLDQGEEPIRILGAFSWQLRKLAAAARLAQAGRPLSVAVEEVGVPPFRRREAEQQLRQLGRRRANRLFDWLLEMDLGLKGSSPLPPRTQLERLLVRLASS